MNNIELKDNVISQEAGLITQRIREMRERENWTQDYMAEQLGMSENGYAKIERGESNLSLKRLQQIADIFEVESAELLKRTMVCFVNENGSNSNNYCSKVGDESLQFEIEKLKLMLNHKEEMLVQKDEQIEALKNLVAVLQATK